jgi:hypothetical protein
MRRESNWELAGVKGLSEAGEQLEGRGVKGLNEAV